MVGIGYLALGFFLAWLAVACLAPLAPESWKDTLGDMLFLGAFWGMIVGEVVVGVLFGGLALICLAKGLVYFVHLFR